MAYYFLLSGKLYKKEKIGKLNNLPKNFETEFFKKQNWKYLKHF